MKKRIGLIGQNINYSVSNVFHNYWLSNLKIEAVYNKIDIEKSQLTTDFILQLIKQNYIGFNITIPYKEDIFYLIKQHSASVKKIKACNTLWLQNGNLVADNTDYFGFIVPLLNINKLDSIDNINTNIKQLKLDFISKNKVLNIFKSNNNALIIGAGGAAKAVVYSLLRTNINKIFIINRSNIKSIKLQEGFGNKRIKVINNFKEINNVSLIVNCTPLLNRNPFDFSYKNLLDKECIFYDLIYNPRKTNFLLKAEQDGFKTLNGLIMLLAQGALSFNSWFGILPKIDNNLINIVNENIK